MFASFTASGAT